MLSQKTKEECGIVIEQYAGRMKEVFGEKMQPHVLQHLIYKELEKRHEQEFKTTFGDMSAKSLMSCLELIKICVEGEIAAMQAVMPEQGESDCSLAAMGIIPAPSDKTDSASEEKKKNKKNKWNPLK